MLIVLIACCLPGLNFEAHAQGPYKLLLRGEPSPFDTAVAIQVQTYRRETAKMAADDRLIKGLNRTVESYQKTIEQVKRAREVDGRIIAEYEQQQKQDAAVKADLYVQVDQLLEQANKQRKPGFFEGPKFWGPLGVVLGVIIGVKVSM